MVHTVVALYTNVNAIGLEESRQLAQNQKASSGGGSSILKRVASMASGAAGVVMGTFSPAKPRVKYPSAWDLPPVSEAELQKAYGSGVRDRRAGGAAAAATCSGTVEDEEDSEEESEGSEYHMSGGLH